MVRTKNQDLKVEEILSHKVDGRGLRFYVKWVGLPREQAQWVGMDKMNCEDMITKYLETVHEISAEKEAARKTPKTTPKTPKRKSTTDEPQEEEAGPSMKKKRGSTAKPPADESSKKTTPKAKAPKKETLRRSMLGTAPTASIRDRQPEESEAQAATPKSRTRTRAKTIDPAAMLAEMKTKRITSSKAKKAEAEKQENASGAPNDQQTEAPSTSRSNEVMVYNPPLAFKIEAPENDAPESSVASPTSPPDRTNEMSPPAVLPPVKTEPGVSEEEEPNEVYAKAHAEVSALREELKKQQDFIYKTVQKLEATELEIIQKINELKKEGDERLRLIHMLENGEVPNRERLRNLEKLCDKLKKN